MTHPPCDGRSGRQNALRCVPAARSWTRAGPDWIAAAGMVGSHAIVGIPEHPTRSTRKD